MKITFVNVGYGDAILLQSNHGFTALLDGGSAISSEYTSPYRIRILTYLQQMGIERLDALLISHIHEDHVCGLESLLGSIPIGQLFIPYPKELFESRNDLKVPAEKASASVHLYTNALNCMCRMIDYAKKNQIKIQSLKQGCELSLAQDFQLQVLGPSEPILNSYLEHLKTAYAADEAILAKTLTMLDAASNQASLLLKLKTTYGDVLLTSDNCPEWWTLHPPEIYRDIRVLKLPHHGQKDCIAEAPVKEMPLEYVITTSASDRRYSSANPWVYERLSDWFSAKAVPQFLFTDEREYTPYFYHPNGFHAIELRINEDGIDTTFILV